MLEWRQFAAFWASLLFFALSFLWIWSGIATATTDGVFDTAKREELRDKVKEMFDHGYTNYMNHAFPLDELRPLDCSGRTKDNDPDNWSVNDVLGNFSLTLIDSLDAHAIMGDFASFEEAVKLVIQHVHFALDSRVQVFEVTIRVLGALLSAHLLASDAKLGYRIKWYKGQLLDLARDLADRLMPAFDSPTGIPWPRVNLKYGVLPYEAETTCSAGAGTLILEFGALSRLTGDMRYEEAARNALFAIWARRSRIDLVGNTIGVKDGKWYDSIAGIGAGIDSFYEYLFKAYVLFGESQYLAIFETAYKALMRSIRDETGIIYGNVDMFTGAFATSWIDSLAAFFPGLQVLAGDIENAAKLHRLYYAIWFKYHALPERFDLLTQSPAIAWYPLRPELVESTYMLYRATRDPYYLQVGEQILSDLNTKARVKCGFATLADVIEGSHDDRMESFFLSETLKYLYLLFDEDNFVHKLNDNSVFTTEGHFISLPYKVLQASQPLTSDVATNTTYMLTLGTCGQYIPQYGKGNVTTHTFSESQGLVSAVEVEYINRLVGLTEAEDGLKHIRQLLKPLQMQVYEVKIEPSSGVVYAPARISKSLGGVMVDHFAGLTLQLAADAGRGGFRILKVNGQEIGITGIVTVPRRGVAFLSGDAHDNQSDYATQHRIVRLTDDPRATSVKHVKFEVTAALADYGPELIPGERIDGVLVGFYGEELLQAGCHPYTAEQKRKVQGNFVLVRRGGCMFVEKTEWAESAGAIGIIVVNSDDAIFSMAPALDDGTESTGRSGGVDTLMIPSLMVSAVDGTVLERELEENERLNIRLYATDFTEPVGTGMQMHFGGQPITNVVLLDSQDRTRRMQTVEGKPFRRWGSRGKSIYDVGSSFWCLRHCSKDGKTTCCGLH